MAAVTGESSPAELREIELSVRGMTCAACAAKVEKSLTAIPDVTATVNFATEKATVTGPTSVPVTRLIAAVENAGYAAEAARPEYDAAQARWDAEREAADAIARLVRS